MKITKSYLQKIMQEEFQAVLKENQGEYSNPGECPHDFFGVLLGYLDGNEDSARNFCEMLHDSRVGDPLQKLQHTMREFEMERGASGELEEAFKAIYGPLIDAGQEWGPKDWDDDDEKDLEQSQLWAGQYHDQLQEGKMNITKSQLQKIIKEELSATMTEDWRTLQVDPEYVAQQDEEEAVRQTKEDEEASDLLDNHNLFVDYINQLKGDDKLTMALKNHKKGNKIHPKVNNRMQQEYKWNFPIDVAPGADCPTKIEALDRVVASFFQNPEMIPVEDTSNTQELGENTGAPSPYEQCRREITQRKRQRKSAAHRAAQKETEEFRDYE